MKHKSQTKIKIIILNLQKNSYEIEKYKMTHRVSYDHRGERSPPNSSTKEWGPSAAAGAASRGRGDQTNVLAGGDRVELGAAACWWEAEGKALGSFITKVSYYISDDLVNRSSKLGHWHCPTSVSSRRRPPPSSRCHRRVLKRLPLRRHPPHVPPPPWPRAPPRHGELHKKIL
jgi:hypothetical protein